jgi:hypothetical protein
MWTRRPSSLGVALALTLAAAQAHGAPQAPSPSEPDEDALAGYRGQFKRGIDRYKAGALTEAIGYWEPIYRELGEQSGYRLAYDLGIAYQESGDPTHAAERLQDFLTEVDARRARGEPLPPIVEKDEADARARIESLIATTGRIRVASTSAPRTARVDAREARLAGFVAWVLPGAHTVTFAAGTPDVEARRVHVGAGEMVEVAPKPPPPPPPPPEPIIVSVAPPPPAPPPVVTRRETHHPFPWPLMAVSGGVALAAGIAAVPLYNNVGALYDRLSTERTIAQNDRESYDRSRTSAYSVAGAAIGFAGVTAGLAAWYFLGTSEHEVTIAPALAPRLDGVSLGMSARF